MSNYGWKLDYIMGLTRNQLVLFKEKIEDRVMEERKFQANLHNMKIKGKGLDMDGAIPIESIIDSGKTNI